MVTKPFQTIDHLLMQALHYRMHIYVFFSFHKAARLKINEEFRKNKNETSEESIMKMIKMGSNVEAVLREGVIQMEHVGDKKLLLRPREGLLLENVPYCDQPRRKS
uniref:LYR motif containing 7 n=1 Tax=Cyclopterus lumpus TaxID=8103 RepID=A0A8C3GC40_CYCLU